LRGVYEAVLGRHLDPANFRRQLRSARDIAATDEVLQGGRNRPPRLYTYTGPDQEAPSPGPAPRLPAEGQSAGPPS
jgi:8-oxo-dGTP diphosphatase